MSSYTLHRTLVFGLQAGTDLYDGITRILFDHSVQLARITGIGALQNAAIACYSTSTGKYEEITLDQPMEITTLSGNVRTERGRPIAHIHVILCDAQGHARAGRLLPGRSPVVACKIIVEEFHETTGVRESDPAAALRRCPAPATL
jgi:predicted DNA-binding protein with PD1-like motif